MFQVGNFLLGDKPFIIAEIGSNWKTIEDCQLSIKVAKECGADAVKFQLFNFESLYGLNKKLAPSWYDKNSELPTEWLSLLRQECDVQRIQLMVSAFGCDLADKVDQYVHCHKIASSEITNVDLLKTISDFAKPVFLSTGGASAAKIELALGILEGCSVVLNYCVGAYPANGTDLFKINELAKYRHPVGFSDHSKDFIYLPRAAIENHGAVAVEKHLTCIKANTPDSPHSLNPAQFKTMCDIIHGRRKTTLNPTYEESDMVLRHQRRLVVTEDVKKGGKVEFGVYRSISPSADGINPFQADTFRDRTAVRDLKAGQTLGVLDIE